MAVDMFLKIDNIKGESTDDRHKDWIEVESFSWGATQSARHHGGGGAGAGKVSMQDFHFVQRVNSASPVLMEAACKGEHFSNATLSVRKAGGKQEDYLVIKLSDVLVSGFQSGGSSGDLPMEQISLNFSKVSLQYSDQNGRLNEASTCSESRGV